MRRKAFRFFVLSKFFSKLPKTENYYFYSLTLFEHSFSIKREWFARRFGKNGTVYEAQINKEHIYALFSGRNESEVIVDLKHLINITKTHMMTHEPQLIM